MDTQNNFIRVIKALFFPSDGVLPYNTPEPERVKAMCVQAGNLIDGLNLPPRVKEINKRFPFLASLACAQGMFHMFDMDNATVSGLPFHKDRPWFSGINSCNHSILDMETSIEPYPLHAFYMYSSYTAEIGFFYGLGMIYERDLLDGTNNLNDLYALMIKEYTEIMSIQDIGQGLLESRFKLELTEDEKSIIMSFIEQEVRFNRCTIKHVPAIIAEKHDIIKFLIGR